MAVRYGVNETGEDMKRNPGRECKNLALVDDGLMSAMHVSVSLHILDRHLTLLHANDYFYKILGFGREEFSFLYGDQCDLLFWSNPEEWEAVRCQVQSSKYGEQSYREWVTCIRRSDGERRAIKLSVQFLKDRFSQYPQAYVVMTDFGTKYSGDLQHSLWNDQGTFELKVQRLLETAPLGKYVFVSLDIQKFKLINELFGIAMGDQVLRHVMKILESSLASGELAVRPLSDQFHLLLYHSGNASLKLRLNEIAAKINATIKGLDPDYIIMFCAGFYPVEKAGEPLEQLRGRANLALKKAKRFPGSGLCSSRFYEKFDREEMLREKELENRMRKALESGEFLIRLQPKFCLKDHRLVGAEALVRWCDPVYGLIYPDEFLPLFEQNGFIVKLDLYVFERVCCVLSRWKESNLTLNPISVNISRAHFGNPNFLQPYLEIRDRYQVPPEFLELELTETMSYSDMKRLTAIAEEIHQAGFRCSLDDFGNGFSSLCLLNSLQVDTIKLDKSFFLPSNTSKKGQDVIASMIGMAKKLGITTVAEGVETQPQAEFLKGLGCDQVQGYVYSKPVTILEFEKLAYGLEVPS